MSAICAVIARDGAPVDPSQMHTLLHAAPHRGSTHQVVRATDAAWLGAQRSNTATARAAIARLGALTIAFHGRFDNLREVQTALGRSRPDENRHSHTAAADRDDDAREAGSADQTAASARTALQAFLQWREACATHLIGDFTFIIWDAARRQAYCARDAVGVKPLYYHASPRRFVVATDLVQVLASGLPLVPCESMVAELLSFDIRTRTETLYQDVLRLPAGHWMTVDDRTVRVVRYWAPDTTTELTYARDEEYTEHFLDVFRRAVGDRAPVDERVAAYLSGGLDSSSVVCMARALGRPLETFSMLFPGVPEADERTYIDAVVSSVGAPAHRIEAASIEAGRCCRSAAARADLPDLPSDVLGAPLLDAMRERGLTTALTGAGGDYGFTGSFLHYAELLQQRDLSGLLRQIRADRNADDVGWSPSELFTSGLRLLIPSTVRRALRPVARRVGWGITVPSWIAPTLAARTRLADRLAAPRTPDPAGPPARQHVCSLFESGWTARLLESGDRMAAERDIELRHPFFDRRLVEFAVALPEAQRWRGPTTKYVLRRAMRELLPESVYARTDKADASAFVPQAVDALGGGRALRRLHIEALGWVRSDRLIAEYDRARRQLARGDSGYCEGMFNVWMALAVETWFRTMFVEGNTYERVTEAEGRYPAGQLDGGGPSGGAPTEAISVAGAR